MTDRPKIPVVTPSFNSAATIRGNPESARRQDCKEWETLFMDSGSKHGAVDMFKNYPHLERVSEKDEGHCHAMNKGLARASASNSVLHKLPA